MNPDTLQLIEDIVVYGSEATTLWNTLKPILAAGREPTTDEWVTLNKMRDDVHASIQGE